MSIDLKEQFEQELEKYQGLSCFRFGTLFDGPLTTEQIEQIYRDCEKSRCSVDWFRNELGEKIGYFRYSIDAWCE